MDEQKICFIYCTNNNILYQESLRYIENLKIPDGFQVEIITILDAKSLTEGYNRAMNQSDAKYKVYLHQDTFIINKAFIQDFVSVFSQHPELGLMGVIGAKKLPPNGVWWKAHERYGKVIENSRTGKTDLLEVQNVTKNYESVDVVDGLILITQYDIPWRDDLFTGWHLYDASQCMEFIRAGLKVGVPRQDEPWCLHDCGELDLEGYEEQRQIFHSEYMANLLPLVSILIPAYNRPKYLEEALNSALSQTYKNIEIIISDDSTNSDVYSMLNPYLEKYKFIHYSRTTSPHAAKNFVRCFEMANGQYINFLMDDDKFHPEKIERMVYYLDQMPDVTLVTSYRQSIDVNGLPQPDNILNRRLFNKNTIVDGIWLGTHMLKNIQNYVGEPTTAMFRKADLDYEYGNYKDKSYNALIDLAVWMSLLAKGKAVYLAESLSYFRQHEGQNLNKLKNLPRNIYQWFELIRDSREDGFLNLEDDYKIALKNHFRMCSDIINKIILNNCLHLLQDDRHTNALHQCVDDIIHFEDKMKCNKCGKKYKLINKSTIPGNCLGCNSQQT